MDLAQELNRHTSPARLPTRLASSPALAPRIGSRKIAAVMIWRTTGGNTVAKSKITSVCILEKPLAWGKGPLPCGYPSQILISGHPEVIPSSPHAIYLKYLESKYCLALTTADKGKAEAATDTAWSIWWAEERCYWETTLPGPVHLTPQLS